MAYNAEYHPPLIATFYGLLLVALYVKPSPYRKLLFLPISCAALVRMLMVQTDDIFDTFFAPQTMALGILQASDFILLTDVQREFRLKTQKQPANTLAPWKRLKWAFTLLFSPRGVGWTHEPHSLPKGPKGLTRAQFCLYQIGRSLWLVFLLDISRLHDFLDPKQLHLGPLTYVLQSGWPYVVLISWGLYQYAFIELYYTLLSIVAVGAGTSNPNLWPPLFGNYKAAYTLGNFWG